MHMCSECHQVPGKTHHTFCSLLGRVPFTPSLQLPSQRILSHLEAFLSEHYLFWEPGEKVRALASAEITVLGDSSPLKTRIIQVSISHHRVSHLLQYSEKTGELQSVSRKSASNQWEKLAVA